MQEQSRQRKVYWFKRLNGHIFPVDDPKQAWKQYKIVVKYPNHFKYLGWSDGSEYYKTIYEKVRLPGKILREKDLADVTLTTDKDVERRRAIREALTIEAKKAMDNPDKRPPKDYDKLDINGNLPNSKLAAALGQHLGQGISGEDSEVVQSLLGQVQQLQQQVQKLQHGQSDEGTII